MKIIRNSGAKRLIDLLRPRFEADHQLDLVTPTFSLFAFAELRAELDRLAKTRLLLPADTAELALLGSTSDRGARNRLQTRWLRIQHATKSRARWTTCCSSWGLAFR
jgi:hypothetical protein